MAEQNEKGRQNEDVTVETDLSAEVAELLALLPADIVEDLNAKRITLGDEGFLEGIVDHLQRHPALVQMNAERIGGHIKKVGKRLRKIMREEHPELEITSTVRRKEPNIGRNSQCPCGSGKKFKNCCIRKQK